MPSSSLVAGLLGDPLADEGLGFLVGREEADRAREPARAPSTRGASTDTSVTSMTIFMRFIMAYSAAFSLCPRQSPAQGRVPDAQLLRDGPQALALPPKLASPVEIDPPSRPSNLGPPPARGLEPGLRPLDQTRRALMLGDPRENRERAGSAPGDPVSSQVSLTLTTVTPRRSSSRTSWRLPTIAAPEPVDGPDDEGLELPPPGVLQHLLEDGPVLRRRACSS